MPIIFVLFQLWKSSSHTRIHDHNELIMFS